MDTYYTTALIPNGTSYNEDEENSSMEKTVNIIRVSLSPLILIGNLLILVTIRKSKSLHRVTFYLLGNLAVADFLFGLVTGLRNALALSGILSGYWCLSVRGFVMMSGEGSLTGTLLLCLQNFLCVQFPIRFKSGLSTRFAWLLMTIFWLLWGVLAVCMITLNDEVLEEECYFITRNHHKIMGALLSFLTGCQLVGIISLQIITLIQTNKRKTALRRQIRSNTNNPSVVSQSNSALRRLERISKVVKIVKIILVLSLVFWGPFIVGSIVFVLCPDRCGIDESVLNILTVFSIFNSLANVFIYYAKSNEFNTALVKMICCCKNKIGVV